MDRCSICDKKLTRNMFFYTCVDCGTKYCKSCGDAIVNYQYLDVSEDNCPYCRGQGFKDADIIDYMLSKYKVEYNTIIKEMVRKTKDI